MDDMRMKKKTDRLITAETEIPLYADDGADRALVRAREEIVKKDAVYKSEISSDTGPDSGSRTASKTGPGAGTDPNRGFYLWIGREGVSLVEGETALQGDFRKSLQRLTPENLNRELLVRAAKIKGCKAEEMTVADATAGMGDDSLLLAAAGFRVQMYERNPVIAALLYDALRRASEEPELASAAERMRLHTGDSIALLPQLTPAPDIVLLDPMFPGRKKTGLSKKKLQLLQQLEQPCEQEEELLNAAAACGPQKIVIKRPLKGTYLAGRKPGFSIRGKLIRYDCIVFPRKS